MTDHHDDLASAYLDGQLSPEESARVESDPALMAEVEALATVVERLQTEEAPTDAGTRQRHLSAALAAFDQLALDPSSAPTNVIALDTAGQRSGGGDEPTAVYPQAEDVARRAARVAARRPDEDALQSRRSQGRRRQGLPSWLSAAAALLVIGGGIGWFMSRQNQSSDTAAVSFGTDSAGGSAAESDAALSQAAESGAPLTTVFPSGESAKANIDSAAGAGAADATQAAAAAPASTATLPAPTSVTSPPSTTTSRPVSTAVPTTAASTTTIVQSSPLAFSSVPTGADVQSRLASGGGSPQPASGSSCGGQVTAPAGTALTGYVAITVNGVPGEGLFYRAGSGSGGTTVLVVRTPSCQPFS